MNYTPPQLEQEDFTIKDETLGGCNIPLLNEFHVSLPNPRQMNKEQAHEPTQ